MKPTEIFDALTAAQCEQIAERFVHAMAGHEGGQHGGTVTAALLTELWTEVRAWTKAPAVRTPSPATEDA